MAQRIHITQKERQKALVEFQKLLKEKTDSPTINFSYNLSEVTIPKNKRPKIVFTEEARQKMLALVAEHHLEIGWHGLVRRKDNVFTIYDILLYPQTTTATQVDTDELEYLQWAMAIDDDTFNSIRMQGHSHVNMSTSPSGKDLELYNTFLKDLKKDAYYIFMIINKKEKHTFFLYDMEKNLKYNTKDIDIDFGQTSQFTDWAKDQIKKHIVKPAAANVTKITPGYKVTDYYGDDDSVYQDYLKNKFNREGRGYYGW